MRLVIHQAYFLPWLGYLSKLAFTDTFIVLDNVNFSKRHFFDRTKIVNMHGEIQWIGLPVGENYKVKCKDVEVKDKDFVEKILKNIMYSYAKADYYKKEWNDLEEALKEPLYNYTNLVDINIKIIKNILNILDIKLPDIYYSSQFEQTDDPTLRLISMCKKLKGDSLLIGAGKSTKVHNWGKFKDLGIKIYIQDYLSDHPVYKQIRRQRLSFEKGLSIIDAILNVGREKTKEFICDKQFEPKQIS